MLRFAFRLMFRLFVLVALIGGLAAAYFMYGRGESGVLARGAGKLPDVIDREDVREAGAQVAAAISQGAGRAEQTLAEARLTAKIKSKMALDDSIEARRLDVDTQGTVVTVRGRVDTQAQRERALLLARETDGVTSVVDRIELAEEPAARR